MKGTLLCTLLTVVSLLSYSGEVQILGEGKLLKGVRKE